MNELKESLTKLLRAANAASAAGRYAEMYEYMQAAAECTRQLAEGSFGAVRQKYCKDHADLLQMIEVLSARLTPQATVHESAVAPPAPPPAAVPTPPPPAAPPPVSASVQPPPPAVGTRVHALTTPDEPKCRRVRALITYPANAVAAGAPLDVLFPSVEKPEPEPEGRTVYELTVDFGSFSRLLRCESKLECRFATVLAATGYATDLKAQTLEIPYLSQDLSTRRYYPDFVLTDRQGRVAVIEMKNYDMVAYHLNIDKYESLRRYCEEHGYGYAEIMKPYHSEEYLSTEMLRSAPVDRELERYVVETIRNKAGASQEAAFTEEDLSRYGRVDRAALYTILLNNRSLKNVDRTGKSLRVLFDPR